MYLVDFPETTVVYAKDQPEYKPFPAYKNENGKLTACWQLSWWERFYVLIFGKVWHQALTFNQPLQPQLLSVFKPEMEP